MTDANPQSQPENAVSTEVPVKQPLVQRRYKMVVAYDGSAFHGWQKQEPPDQEPLRTVQGELQSAMQRLLGQRLILTGASRTDAGVHAQGQVVHFDATVRIPIERLAHAINGRLPDDIDVRHVLVVPQSFESISGAKNKQYRYRLYNTRSKPLGLRDQVFHCWVPLNIDRMQDAAKRLIGTYDFEGFASAGHGRTSTIRTIYDCHIEHQDHLVDIVVSGNGFLWNMVRIIAGTLVEVGRGHFQSDRINEILKTADRQLAGPTLPPTGLTLEWIRYEDGTDIAPTSIHNIPPQPFGTES